MLRANNITKVYFDGTKLAQPLCVLKEVTIKIAKGEFLSIVGPSGAGKSTLLHILSGLDEPTQGSVFLDDFCLSTLDDMEKAMIRNTRFGFVFQFYHLLHEFNALENVLMPGLLKKGTDVKELKKKALELLGDLGLSERVKHKPSQLSGGEQQRVAIARALMNDPEILFCDEPTGNLDHVSGKQISEMLLRLNQTKKTTVVIVTHSRELAAGSHRILNILDGRITEGSC
ncbi:MAG: ABC transporter ATP-binding protein [Candidatus Omnitrophota bacterium]